MILTPIKFNPLLSLMLLFFFPTEIYAQGGGSIGNGGKRYGAYLTEEIVKIYEILDSKCENLSYSTALIEEICKTRSNFFKVLMQTRIGTEHIVYGKDDLKPRDAVNGVIENPDSHASSPAPDPAEARFFITYSIRNLQKSTPEDRRRVLLHEFMTLAQKESSDSYAFSTLVLRFIADSPLTSGILAELPQIEKQERHFVGRDLSVLSLLGVHPVLLRDSDEYTRFCIGKGYDAARNMGARDLPLKAWRQFAGTNTQNPVIIDNRGEVSSVTQNLPEADTRVLYSVTCY